MADMAGPLIARSQGCAAQVLLLAVQYLDRLLATSSTWPAASASIRPSQLQLAAAAALFVASKLCELRPLTVQIVVLYMDEDEDSDDVTPAMVAFLTQKDKSVSHAQIENFIHKSKVRYSVNEIQTAIKNAKAIGVETLIEPDARQEIVDKWKMMLEAIKKHDVEGETTGGTFSKSKPISISTARPAEGQTRLKLLKDVRSINKVDKLVPNTPGGHPRPETPEDHAEEQPTRTTSKPTASSAAMTSKASKGKSKTSKKDDSHTAQQTLSKDTGKKVPLALAT